ncbi:MAG: CHAT domain-containing protein, partial [Microcystaceae cyanobacterium]
MSVGVTPCLSLAIARLTAAGSENFAIWVLNSPLPGGYVHHDLTWTETLTQKWLAWQEMFSLQNQPHLPIVPASAIPSFFPLDFKLASPSESYGGRLMQELGISLWQWLFDGPIRQSLSQSSGLALGQNKPLRL